MQTFFAALFGLFLFGNIDSIHIDRSHHLEFPKNIERGEEDKKFLGRVPVYNYKRALRYAQGKSRNFVNSLDDEPIDEEKTEVTWVVVFDESCNITEEQIEILCNKTFMKCTNHADRSGKTGHLSWSFLITHSTVPKLNVTLETADKVCHVKFCEGDYPISIADAHLDYSHYLIDDEEATWGLNRIGKSNAPGQGYGVHAYVLDTGVRHTHTQFEGRAIPTIESLGVVRHCECENTTCARDSNGHGTHCAGTIAAVDYGVAPQTRIHSVKVLADDGFGFTSWTIMANGWIQAHAMRPCVVSMSLGGEGNNFASEAQIQALVGDGIPVVVAAGNEEANSCDFTPAFINEAITVGSTDESDGLSWFSNYGTCVDILAPGSNVLSTGHVADGSTAWKSGTSMACPHVSGAVSILLGLNKLLTPSEIKAELFRVAVNGTITDVPIDTPNILLQVNGLSGNGTRRKA